MVTVLSSHYTQTNKLILFIECEALMTRNNLMQDELHVTNLITLSIGILYMGFPIRAKHVIGLHAISISLHNTNTQWTQILAQQWLILH